MGDLSLLDLVMRWLHILTAIVAVGGSSFLRLVLMPVAAKVLSDEEHQRLRGPLLRRWKWFVHAGILLFVISGFYNYFAVTGTDRPPLYHALFGVKFIVALGVFFLAVALTSTKDWSAKLRARARTWLLLLLLAAVLVVMIGGVLKSLPKTSGNDKTSLNQLHARDLLLT